jgi:hypothetical protein
MSEHRPTDRPGGDDGAFLDEEPRKDEHPLEGGQGDEVDEAQEESEPAPSGSDT